MILSRAHTSTRAQQTPLTHSSWIQYHKLTSTTHLKKQADLYLQQRAGQGFCQRFGPVLFCASKLTVVD